MYQYEWPWQQCMPGNVLLFIQPKKLKKKKNIPAPPTVRHHRGHKLEAKQFNVLTVCEACDQRIPVLGHGMVCKGEQYLQ